MIDMRDDYDFGGGKKKPYAKRLKKQISIRLDTETVAYFEALAEETGIPYQTLINMDLRECADQNKKPSLEWVWQPQQKNPQMWLAADVHACHTR